MGIAHAHGCLVDVESLLLQVAELESGHDVVISLLCIEVLGTWLVGGERSDTVHKSLLYEVVTEVHIVFFAYGECYVERTGPVTLCQHLKHHEIALVECALAGKRDDHLVWNRI